MQDSRSSHPQRQGTSLADIVTIQTPSLGDRSYLVPDGATGFVVDPQRDIDRVLALAAGRGISVTRVFETHIHNDYVSGGLALAPAPPRRPPPQAGGRGGAGGG